MSEFHQNTFFLESLEDRIAPVALIDGSTVTYQDADGDLVTVKFSKKVLTQDNVNDFFEFDNGSVNGSDTAPQALLRLNLDDSVFSGINVAVEADGNGDGKVEVGEIFSQQKLGKIFIEGDLTRFELGNVKSLEVETFGAEGAFPSKVINLGQFIVSGDFRGQLGGGVQHDRVILGSLLVGGDFVEGGLYASSVKSIDISGSMILSRIRADSREDRVNVGLINIAGDMSLSTISTDDGSFRGLTIGGSFLDSNVSAVKAGFIVAKEFKEGDIDCEGTMGRIVSLNDMSDLRIRVDNNEGSGLGLLSAGGAIIDSSITIQERIGTISARNLMGTEIDLSGGGFGKLAIDGSMESSRIFSDEDVATGRISIGSMLESRIDVGKASSVSVMGDVGAKSYLAFNAQKAPVHVFGDVHGSVGGNSLAKVVIDGDVLGGSVEADFFGSVVVKGSVNAGAIFVGELGTLKISGDVDSSRLEADAPKNGISIGGEVRDSKITYGYLKKLTIEKDVWNSEITASHGVMGSLAIKGSVYGTAETPTMISAVGDESGKAISSINIGGNVSNALILAGYRQSSPVSQNVNLGKVFVGGDWTSSSIVAGIWNEGFPNFGNDNDQFIDSNSESLPEIGSIVVKGTAERSNDEGRHFGFSAGLIGAVSVNGQKLQIPSPGSFTPVGTTGNFDIHILG